MKAVRPQSHSRQRLAILVCCVAAACRSAPEAPPQVGAEDHVAAPLPDNQAGRVVARAITAAGGWETWNAHRDASFISTLTLFDPVGNATSETIFLHKVPLHQGLRTRMESIGLREELLFGFDGDEWWMLQDGRPVSEPARTVFTQFHGISSAYWFSLPFILAEGPAALTYVGPESDGDQRWEKVRVEHPGSLAAPADWLVVYFDAGTGLIDRVHCHITAEFLRQTLWVGKWRDYRSIGGIKRERRRTFFPADMSGNPIGGMAAEQILEHLQFDNDYPASLFTKPLVAGGGNPA